MPVQDLQYKLRLFAEHGKDFSRTEV